MLKRRKLASPEQLNLFHPPRCTPCWTDLPPSARREVVELLTRMFREKYRSQKEAKSQEGGEDE